MNEQNMPAGELSDVYIKDVAEHLLSAGAYEWIFGVIEFTRAIIEADRTLRASPVVGDVGMPVIGWLGEDANGHKALGLNDGNVSRYPGMRAEPLIKQSDAQAALAAKDADYALGVSMLRAEIARLRSDLARPESLDVGLMRAEIAALTTDRDEWKESTIDANKRFKTAEQDVYTMTAERDALKAESIKTESTTARLRMDYGSMAQRLTEMVRMCGGYQDQVVALIAERDALRKPETARMTAADIEEMMNNMAIYDGDYETAIVRATEKHHGIGL